MLKKIEQFDELEFDNFDEFKTTYEWFIESLTIKKSNNKLFNKPVPIVTLRRLAENAVYEQVNQFNFCFNEEKKYMDSKDDDKDRFFYRLREIFNDVGKLNILLEAIYQAIYPCGIKVRIRPLVENIKFKYGLMVDDNTHNFRYWKFHNVDFDLWQYFEKYDDPSLSDTEIEEEKPRQWEHAELFKCNFSEANYELRGLGAADFFENCQLNNHRWLNDNITYLDNPFENSNITLKDQLKIIRLYHYCEWVKPEFGKSPWEKPKAVTLSTDFSESQFDKNGEKELMRLTKLKRLPLIIKNTQEYYTDKDKCKMDIDDYNHLSI